MIVKETREETIVAHALVSLTFNELRTIETGLSNILIGYNTDVNERASDLLDVVRPLIDKMRV